MIMKLQALRCKDTRTQAAQLLAPQKKGLSEQVWSSADEEVKITHNFDDGSDLSAMLFAISHGNPKCAAGAISKMLRMKTTKL